MASQWSVKDTIMWYYYIILSISSNFYIVIDPFYPVSCATGSIIMVELRGIWILPSPQILESIMHDKFWQHIVGTTSINSLYFISTIPVRFVRSMVKVFEYFVFPFYFPYKFFLINYILGTIQTKQGFVW